MFESTDQSVSFIVLTYFIAEYHYMCINKQK